MKRLIIAHLIISLFFVNSCISRQVKKGPNYTENFFGYFTSSHGNEIVFIGQKYHYIFKDENGEVATFTKPEWKSKLRISDINLRVDKDNNVYGSVKLEFAKEVNQLSSSELRLAKSQGFLEGSKYLGKNINLKGIRYEPSRGFDASIGNGFSKKYQAKIIYDLKPSAKVRKAALTPVAYVADGFLILVGGIWIPLIIIAVTDENTPEKFMDKLYNR